MTKKKEIPQPSTEIRKIDGVERVVIIRQLSEKKIKHPTTIGNVSGGGPRFKREFTRKS